MPCPGNDYPLAPYIPGRSERPREAIFDTFKDGLSTNCTIAELASSSAFRGGLTFYEAGYYWEAHELWEAVWMCLPPASAERHLLRGLIQLANAGLKRVMDRPEAAARILALADTAIAEAFLHPAGALMGLSRDHVQALRNLAVDRQ